MGAGRRLGVRGGFVAALALVGVGLLAACGSSEAPPAPVSATSEATASPTPAAATASPAPEATRTPVRSRAEEAALAEELAGIAIRTVFEEFGADAGELSAAAFPLGVEDAGGDGALWAVVTNGPQPFYENAAGEGVNFFHFVALYRREAGGTWSEALARLTLETAPQRTPIVEVIDPGPRAGRPPAALIAILGTTGAHSGTLDVVLAEEDRLETVVSHVSAGAQAGGLVDLDGDGLVEVVLDTSNPYVFCYACRVVERSEQVYRWTGATYEAVALAAPPDLEGDLAARAQRVVALAEGAFWREAATLAIETSRRAPAHEGLRWLSTLVNRTAAQRLALAGTGGQPLLANVFAGEYGAAFAMMEALAPEEAFALDGPLIAGTEAEFDLPTMVAYLLLYAEEALKVRDDDPAIHAVRALAFALASPDDLSRARTSLGRALRLAPENAFLQQAAAFLEGAERAPGLPPEAPSPEALREAPPAAFFADFTLGSGDRGRRVRALHQRLTRIPALGFRDPGRFYDVYDEATRDAVLQVQVEAGLPPDGVVDGATWEAIEAAVEAAQAEARRAASPPATPPPRNEQVAHGAAGQPVVYLTFDDGPHPQWTPRVLEVLARHEVRATFFVLGQSVAAYPELTARLLAAGHEVENHTFDHASLDKVDRETFIAEVEDTDAAIHAAAGAGVDPIACLRPPYGAVDEQTRTLSAELGKALTLWNVDPQDWRRPGSGQIATHLLAHARPGAILLMHDGGGERSQTVEALDRVLAELGARGYEFGLLCR